VLEHSQRIGAATLATQIGEQVPARTEVLRVGEDRLAVVVLGLLLAPERAQAGADVTEHDRAGLMIDVDLQTSLHSGAT
jgi:hypothetical protein